MAYAPLVNDSMQVAPPPVGSQHKRPEKTGTIVLTVLSFVICGLMSIPAFFVARSAQKKLDPKNPDDMADFSFFRMMKFINLGMIVILGLAAVGGVIAVFGIIDSFEDSTNLSCIKSAQRCALRADGSDGSDTRQRFDTCLDESIMGDCSDACDGDNAAACQALVAEIDSFSGDDNECRSHYRTCMDDCYDDLRYSDDNANASETVTMCLSGTGSQSCSQLARSTQDCGGTLDSSSEDYCREQCVATSLGTPSFLSDCQRDCRPSYY